MSQVVRIAPSILAADFAHLGDAVKTAESAGADQIHVDVMDGHFVPNISMGPVVVEAIRRVTDLPLDVHLMISEPDRYAEAFARAGANALTFHIEAVPEPGPVIRHIHALGLRAGLSLRPGTPLDSIRAVAGEMDILLIMSVEPGFGGQAFMDGSVNRIRQARGLIGDAADLSVDGGIEPENAGKVIAAGANVLVAGSSIFKTKDGIAASIADLRQAATGT